MVSPPGPSVIIAQQLESAGDALSGLGEHGLANQVWAVAARLRRRARKGHSPVTTEKPRYTVAIWPDDEGWLARVAGVSHGNLKVVGAVTCGVSEEDIKHMAVDLVATILDADPEAFEVEFEYEAYL